MSDIYISYARENDSVAVTLAERLQEEGFSVWFDKRLQTGEEWAEQISRELRNAKCVLVLWSRASIGSAWVAEEAAYAQERDSILPVRVEDVDLPLRFAVLDYIDLIDWAGDRSSPSFQRLRATIAQRLGRPL